MSRLSDLRLDIDPVQTRLAVGFNPAGFIGHKVLPIYPFPGQSFKVKVFDKAAMVLPAGTRFPTGAERPQRVSFSYSYATGEIERYGLESQLDVEEVAAAGVAGINVVTRARATAQFGVELFREQQAATLVQTAANFGTNTDTAADTWDTFTNDVSDADPLVDIRDAKDGIMATTGRKPNVAWCSYELWQAIQLNTFISARLPTLLASTGGADPSAIRQDITEAQFARLIGVEEFYVGSVRYAASADATTTSALWDDDSFGLAYRNPNPSEMEEPSFGYTITRQFGQTADGLPVLGLAGTDLLTPWASAYWYVAHYVHKLTLASAGYLITGCHS